MAEVTNLFTSYIQHLENVAISADEVYDAITQAVASKGLPDIKTTMIKLKESGGLFSKKTYRDHFRIFCDFTTFQIYVAQYADRYTIIGMRVFINNNLNPHKGGESPETNVFPRDIAKLRRQVVERAILSAIDTVVKNKGQRPTWTTENEGVRMSSE